MPVGEVAQAVRSSSKRQASSSTVCWVLLVAGAAGGLGAIFRAPLGGALTAVEVLYKEDLETDALTPAILSSVTAYTVFCSINGFTHVFARLLGRQGGVSGLTAHEMDILAAFHARHQSLNESLLREAFDQAASSTIPEVLFQLQSLLHERND